MALAVLAILGGFALLIWSADRFVEGAAATAKHAGMPSLLIGMVIVGFGTSSPEMVVSAMAALDGSPGLALGNALGSNIANTGLILGITALIAPIAVHSKIVRRELPLLLIVSLLVFVILWDHAITRPEALLLLGGFLGLIGWTVFTGLRNREDALAAEIAIEMEARTMPLGRALFWLVVGMLLLIVSSRFLIWGAVEVAQGLGISDFVIGLTIVALGTSLPELAASMVAARKGEHDIAIGNVVGSNILNILVVLAVPGLVSEPVIDNVALWRDCGMMLALTLAPEGRLTALVNI